MLARGVLLSILLITRGACTTALDLRGFLNSDTVLASIAFATRT